MKKYFPSSELIINEDGSVFHLHVKPEWLADKVILVGDPGRVALVASHFENKECEVESREFKTITGTYKGKRITVVSTGIGCDNIDIVMNELDALANIDFVTREEKDQFRQLECGEWIFDNGISKSGMCEFLVKISCYRIVHRHIFFETMCSIEQHS